MNYGVIDLGFGDSGKGLVTDYLCSQNPNAPVVRFSGGQQAGHTVQIGDIRHTFSNFGSGTLRGNPTYWSEYCTVDPVGITNEYAVLLEKGVSFDTIKLYLNPKSPITTPYDKLHNQFIHKNQIYKHGTCGSGVGQTWQREEDHYHLTVNDLFNHYEIFLMKFEQIRLHYYNHIISPKMFDDFITACLFVKRLCKCTDDLPELTKTTGTLIFEGSQGLMLDQNIGIFPHVTRSNTGSKNILEMVKAFKPYVVTRCYETRHGDGPATGKELPKDAFVDNIIETNVDNDFQGKFRKQMLNLDTLKYALWSDDYISSMYNTVLVITCTDHMRDKFYLSANGKVQIFNDKYDFGNFISRSLLIPTTMLSSSAESNTFKEISVI